MAPSHGLTQDLYFGVLKIIVLKKFVGLLRFAGLRSRRYFEEQCDQPKNGGEKWRGADTILVALTLIYLILKYNIVQK